MFKVFVHRYAPERNSMAALYSLSLVSFALGFDVNDFVVKEMDLWITTRPQLGAFRCYPTEIHTPNSKDPNMATNRIFHAKISPATLPATFVNRKSRPA